MAVIARATGPTAERRFVARAARIDSTVVEADIRYPTDLGLAQDAARMLAVEAQKSAELAGSGAPKVRDRSRAIFGRLRRLNRSIAGRTGHSKELALRLTAEAGELAARSLREARRLVATLRSRARGRGARAKLRAAERIERIAERARKVCEQITRRVSGQKITDRLVSMSDPDARPIRKGKLRHPTEFGTVMQVAELCENTRRGARGLIVPLATAIGSPNEHQLLERTGERLDDLGLRPARSRSTAGSRPAPSTRTYHHPTDCSSPAATLQARRRPTAGSRSSASAPKTHQPPQTPLRHAQIQAQRPPRRQDMGRLGDPRLQPRHARHPQRLTASTTDGSRPSHHPERPRLPPERGRSSFTHRRACLSGASS